VDRRIGPYHEVPGVAAQRLHAILRARLTEHLQREGALAAAFLPLPRPRAAVGLAAP
jgi:hypothetical protein